MDCYCLRLADCKGEPLVVIQRIFAGQAPEPLAAGTCARIFTGAPVPAGADCVEMQENAVVEADQRIRFTRPMVSGQNIRPDRKSTRLTPVTNAHLVCRLLLEKKNQNKPLRHLRSKILISMQVPTPPHQV